MPHLTSQADISGLHDSEDYFTIGNLILLLFEMHMMYKSRSDEGLNLIFLINFLKN